jgi:hypothetical protein
MVPHGPPILMLGSLDEIAGFLARLQKEPARLMQGVSLTQRRNLR